MKVFYLVLISTFIISLIARIVEDRKKRPNLFFSLIVIAIIALVAGLRWGIGDTGDYVHLYGLIGPDYKIFNGGYEPGFILFLMLLKSITEDPQFLILVTSLIINILNIWTIRKYSKDSYFELAVFMYIASGYYLVTMNGMRQCLAVSAMFAATELIIRGKFKRYLILSLVMAMIHNSALIMIPMYFVVRQEAWSKNIYRLLILFIIGLAFYEPLMQLVFTLLGDSKYAGYSSFNEGGANVLRVIVHGVPIFLAYIKRDILKEKLENGNVLVNMCLINFMIMGFSLFNWIFARFALYTQLYSFILLPYIIKHCFPNSKEKRLVYFGFIICFFIFFIYEYQISMHISYQSKIDLSNLFYIIGQ